MKTIVLLLSQIDQQELWLQLLASQGLSVTTVSPEEELIDRLETLPDLILLDLGIKSKDGNTLQASDVGRWLKSKQINDRLVLVNPKEEGQIKDMERRWALRQGAVEVLPRLDHYNLIEQGETIAKLLGINFDREAVKSLITLPAQDEEITSFGSLADANAYYERAKSRLLQNNLSGALYDIEKAIEMDESVPDYFCLRAQILFQEGLPDRALADLDIALQINRRYRDAYYWKGIIRSSLGENKTAIHEFDQAIKLDNKFSEAYNDRGLAKFSSGDERGAMQDYNQAIKLKPNFDRAFNNRGLLLYAQGNTKQAIQDFSQAIKINSNFADAYYNRGNVFNDNGDFEQAIKDYTEAIRCNPEFAEAYGNRGLAYFEIDNYRQALLDTQKAAELFQKQGNEAGYQQALATYRQMQS